MEAWVPLFKIFLNSPCPEGEASLWMQKSFDPSNLTTTPCSFLSLLSKPTDLPIQSSSSSSSSSSSFQSKRVMWIQTLPNAVQSRILSFLTVERRRFCGRDLQVLASNVLKGNEELDFWVKKAACNLLDEMSSSSFGLNVGSGDGRVEEEEFAALPSWLQSESSRGGAGLLFPWLPISRDELGESNLVSDFSDEKQDEGLLVEVEEQGKGETLSRVVEETKTGYVENAPLGPEIQREVAGLKAQILTFESTSKTAELADEIRGLCFNETGGGNSLLILGLIEPWKADDETASILLSHLSAGGQDVAWPSHVLCSVVLPKLLVLGEPASRLLVTAIIGFCKLHQKAAVDALLLPLVLRKEGINTPICDVVTRIIRDCLHPAHCSSFCHKMLCGEPEARGIVCLPCHQFIISSELVWTEPLFTLFQNILNFGVYLNQDLVDHLVSAVQQSVGSYSKSLKFGNFLLCFITKCDQLLKHHKFLLTEIVEQTNTFVTKSILSKLGRL